MKNRSYLITGIALMLLYASTFAAGVGPSQPAEQNDFEKAQRILVRVDPSADAEERENRAATREAIIAWGTVGLAAVTLLLWLATVRLAKEASQSAGRQLDVATASAKAMAELADATRNNATLMSSMLRKQMRAFVAAHVGGAHQQSGTLRFEGSSLIENVGLTPARNVSYWIAAKVMDFENPDLSKPAHIKVVQNDMTLNPRASIIGMAVVDDHFSDDAVQEISAGLNRRLFVWGEVLYEDEYGENRLSKFCHNYIFVKTQDGKTQWRGYIYRIHNSST